MKVTVCTIEYFGNSAKALLVDSDSEFYPAVGEDIRILTQRTAVFYRVVRVIHTYVADRVMSVDCIVKAING